MLDLLLEPRERILKFHIGVESLWTGVDGGAITDDCPRGFGCNSRPPGAHEGSAPLRPFLSDSGFKVPISPSLGSTFPVQLVHYECQACARALTTQQHS